MFEPHFQKGQINLNTFIWSHIKKERRKVLSTTSSAVCFQVICLVEFLQETVFVPEIKVSCLICCLQSRRRRAFFHPTKVEILTLKASIKRKRRKIVLIKKTIKKIKIFTD